MNRKINSYVNYLLDNEPSPFCEYIICKELLKEDEKTIRDTYEWAKRFKLYKDINDIGKNRSVFLFAVRTAR